MKRLLAFFVLATWMWASASHAQNARVERFFTENAGSSALARAQLAIVQEVVTLIAQQYVDAIPPDDVANWAIGGMTAIRLSPGATDPVQLAQAAIKGIQSSLDPHSGYLDAKALQNLQIQQRGSFGGIGLEVNMVDDTVNVVSPLDETPAARASLRSGDRITHVDGISVAGQALNVVVDRMRGPIGSNVRLTIQRQGRSSFDVDLRRAEIRIEPVAWRLDGNIGYLRIKVFLERTKDAIIPAVAAIRSAAGNSLAGIVVDVRNNPGGLLSEAVAVADQFLTYGEIASLRGREPKNNRSFSATAGDITFGTPLVVLANKGTASGAEILANALRQNGRAQIVGETTFGKGSIQTIFPMKSAGALKLTSARQYTKMGTTYDGKGLQPDVAIGQPEGEATDFQLDGARALLTGASIPATAQRAATPPAASRFPTQPVAVAFRPGPARPDDIAVIIANADYAKLAKDIPNVTPAYADAEGVKRYVTQSLGVREGNIIYLKDATGAQMTRVFGSERDHRGQLFDWVKAGKSRVFVYYAGHGAPALRGGSPYLVPVDADPTRIELNGYPLKTLYDNLAKLPAESLTVVIESCFSGVSQAGSVIARASPVFTKVEAPKVPPKMTVITAGAADQVASWEESKAHSLFTQYFLKGMAGEADKAPYGDGNGSAGLDELDRYLKDTLTYYARRYYGRDQTAQIVRSARP